MKKNIFILITTVFIGVSCSSKNNMTNTNLSLSDKKATPETVSLYKKLNQLTQKGFLFGHQDDLAYGVNWKYENGKSDIKYKRCHRRLSCRLWMGYCRIRKRRR
jgi:mannan endo-1,4-beta-mannosidase